MKKFSEDKNKLEVGEGEEKTAGLAVGRAAQAKFEIHFIDTLQQQHFQTIASILIVDSRSCLVEELEEYKSNDPNDEVMSLATYSNRELVILTYISIFETLWTQTELTQSNR